MIYRDLATPPQANSLIYIMDPMCSWCWAFAPAIVELKSKLPSDMPIYTIMGGLAPDSDASMPTEMQNQIQQIWKQISTATGTQFNNDFWSQNTPRRSTYQSCRAVIAAALSSPTDLSDQMILAIQHAYYLGAKNPSDADMLVALADQIGLDKNAFRTSLCSQQTELLLQQHLDYKRMLGVQGFPSLLWFNGESFQWLAQGYTDSKNLFARAKALGINLKEG